MKDPKNAEFITAYLMKHDPAHTSQHSQSSVNGRPKSVIVSPLLNKILSRFGIAKRVAPNAGDLESCNQSRASRVSRAESDVFVVDGSPRAARRSATNSPVKRGLCEVDGTNSVGGSISQLTIANTKVYEVLAVKENVIQSAEMV